MSIYSVHARTTQSPPLPEDYEGPEWPYIGWEYCNGGFFHCKECGWRDPKEKSNYTVGDWAMNDNFGGFGINTGLGGKVLRPTPKE